MIYVSVTFGASMEVSSPEAWFERTAPYLGILECLAIDNTVINVKRINYEGDVTHKGIDYRFIHTNHTEDAYPRTLIRYVKNLNPDIVLIQGLHLPMQIIMLRKALGKKIKFIAQNHAEKPAGGLKGVLQKLADQRVDAYLFASHDLGADWVKQGIISSPEKIHEVMEVSSTFSPMDKMEALQKTGAKGSPVFLWVGRLDANKDPLTVLRAFLRFTCVQPDARLYMVYHTEELLQEVKDLLERFDPNKMVTLVGKLPHAQLQYWYNSADIILSGSYYEGSGTAVCEAMSCGCMPIVTDIPSFRMITDNGQCGLLYKPGDEEALLALLKKIHGIDLAEKQRLSLKYFKSNLSFEAIARQIQTIAESL
jgi:glycosyltransferase involved in cell wall biosynthesis